MKSATSKKRVRKVSCRAAVRRVLAEHDVSAEAMLVAMLDVAIDGYVDRELRERGLGPERAGSCLAQPMDDSLNSLMRDIQHAEFKYGKGFGRQPARGTIEDVIVERSAWWKGTFDQKLTPTQRAVRHLLGAGFGLSKQFLDAVDPPDEDEEDAPVERAAM